MLVDHWTARIQVAACMYRASNMLDNRSRVIRCCDDRVTRLRVQGVDDIPRA
jgi:hypothetical protein